MNGDDLRGLMDRATFLHERLGETWQPTPHPFDADAVERRLARWCQLTAGGNWNRFAQRLTWDGLDLASARPLLGTGRHAPETPLPEWADFLAQVIDAAGDHPVRDIAGYFVDAAQPRLARQAGSQLTWLSPFARQSLTAYLAERLDTLTRATLAADSDRSLSAYCLRYPVLARQLAQSTLNWVAEVTDFLAHLAEDWPTLAQHVELPRSAAPGAVNAVQPGLSDPHRGGRTVWRVELGGVPVAYKPKNMQMDASWAELVKWAASQGLDACPGHLWIIARRDHGWMEWVQPDPQPDTQRLARNVGGLLALLHLVHAADCHAENLATRGDVPLLLDAEMLVYPQFTGHEDADPLDVMRTGLLPLVGRRQRTGRRPQSFGEDMEIRLAQATEGYGAASDWLAGAWPVLDGEDGVLARLRRGQARIAPRPTAAYLRLLDHLRHPAFLTDAIDFSIEADRLAYSYLNHPDQARFAPLLAAEHQAVNQGDVPLFHGEIDHPDLPGLPLPDGADVQRLRWPSISLPSPADKVQQAALIQASLDRASYAAGIPQTFIDAACHLGDLLAQRAILIGEAEGIERGLSGSGGSDGLKSKSLEIRFDPPDPRSISWIAVQYQPRAGLWQHGLVGEDLYAGRAGIALFLAALAHVTGEERWRDLALAGFVADQSRQGTTHNWAGRVYALSVAADLLQEPALQRQAESLALSTAETPPQSTPHPWGVLDGVAGDVLALLKLHAQTDDARWLVRAARLGDAILRAADTWTHEDRALGGYSHGAAGIADTLLRLHHATGDDQFLAGAAQAWEFQQRLFSDPPGNWQDRRGPTPVFLRTGCNGAAGSAWPGCRHRGLPPSASADRTRRCTAHRGPPHHARHSSAAAIRPDRRSLQMGLLQNRLDWIERASAQARQMLSRSAESGVFRLYDDLPSNLFNPGFFRNVAGIGYTLLRLAVMSGELPYE
ncbi:MAG: DUF4135 domain-containing protein [Caldilineaceae bacterium]